MELFDFDYTHMFFCNYDRERISFVKYDESISKAERKALSYDYTNRFEYRDVINLHR